MSSPPTTSTGSGAQPLEMLITGDELPNPDSRLLPVVTGNPDSPKDGEEEALESHEVIELQQFSERKAWIEEKIKVNLISTIRSAQVNTSTVPREHATN
jgi:hypothetical protein